MLSSLSTFCPPLGRKELRIPKRGHFNFAQRGLYYFALTEEFLQIDTPILALLDWYHILVQTKGGQLLPKRKIKGLFAVAILGAVLLAACGGVANEVIAGDSAGIVQVGPFQVLTSGIGLFELEQPAAVGQANFEMRKDVLTALIAEQIEAQAQGVYESRAFGQCPFASHK